MSVAGFYKLVLRGALAGKNGTLNGYRFIGGECDLGLLGEREYFDNLGVAKYFKRAYQADLVMYRDPEPINLGFLANREEPEPIGLPVGTKSRLEQIADAVRSLDPANDEHWTQLGLPRVDAVEEVMNDATVTRAEITEALPDYERPR